MPLVPADAATPLLLRTLGSAQLSDGAGERVVLGPGKPFALLVYIALAPGRRCSRESLIDLLWSDVDPDRARNALRQSLFQLRRVLGDDALTGSEELTLLRPIHIDRDAFLAALDANELDAAIALYGGLFLPAFGVPGGAAFEQWADLERERLQAGFMRGAELLVRRHLNQSRLADAKQLARRVRDLLPHDEAAGRLILEVSIAGREFASAAMDANALEQWAASEGAVLEPATRAAIARARRVAPVTENDRDTFALVAELTGREQEFFAITAAWDAVRTGPARHLHLSAPAGLGKTRLLRDAVSRLEASGAIVVLLRGKPGDRDLPYAFASDLAAAICALPGAAGVAPASASTLLALNPTLSTHLSGPTDLASGEEALRRRILALTDLVHAVADEQRFVLAIDDLHWIDIASYRVLEGVWGRLNRAHVLCLSASRPERVPVAEPCTMLTLSALTDAQVGALVSALGFIPPDEAWSASFVSGLFEATRGSPLLILETLRHALEQGLLVLSQSEWRCVDAPRLASLLRAGEALRERMRALPPAQLTALALLSTAGTPIDRSALSAMTAVSREILAERIEPLEQQGLVARTSAGLVPAHDEIAAAAIAALTPDQRVVAERTVGEFFERSGDVHGVLRAIRHFAAAGDQPAVRRLFRVYAQLARQRGDRRPYDEIAADLLGAGTAAIPATLVRELPLSWRCGLWSPVRQLMALALALLLPAIAAATWRMRVAADATSQRFVTLDSTHQARVVRVSANDWDDQSTAIDARDGTSAFLGDAAHSSEFAPVISPDGRSVAWTQASGDSTTLDIWLRTPSGTRRLTRSARDDVASAWLPDGSALVGLTDRWWFPGSLGYDVAVFDTATGAARPLSSGPSHDGLPVISPDGTRVAFLRESDDFPTRLCVTTIDGATEPECRVINSESLNQPLGWSALDEILVIVDGPESSPLLAYDWARRSTRPILGPHVWRGRLSPDRRWVSATVRTEGMRGEREWIAPIDRPAQARPVDHVPPNTLRWWEGRPDRSLLIDRIEFADSTNVIPLGLGTRLRVRLLTAANAEVPLRVPVRWRSSDTLVATVDTTGEVRPRKGGRTTITASLVGWRSVSRLIRVEGELPQQVLDERWDTTWPTRWIAWGDPQPLVLAGPGGVRGFWNHGDGVYPSFGVMRRAFSARHGLGVEMRVSTPLGRTPWQRFRVNLAAGLDTEALSAADQHKAPPAFSQSDANCGVSFPGTGRWRATRMGIVSSVAKEVDLAALGDTLRTGAWWTLRIQVLPDGRCGVAVNHHVLWISPEPMRFDREFRVRLGDESVDTQILHGPLRVWTGVLTDIDWTLKKP